MIKNKMFTLSPEFWEIVSQKWAQKIDSNNLYDEIDDAPIIPMEKDKEKELQFDPFDLDDI